VLAAAHLQASTAKLLLARGEVAQVNECLDNLADTTLQAEADMRGTCWGQTMTSADRPFFATLREYIVRFTRQYGLPVELSVPLELEEQEMPQPSRCSSCASSRKGCRTHASTLAPAALRSPLLSQAIGRELSFLMMARDLTRWRWLLSKLGIWLAGYARARRSAGGILRVESTPGGGQA